MQRRLTTQTKTQLNSLWNTPGSKIHKRNVNAMPQNDIWCQHLMWCQSDTASQWFVLLLHSEKVIGYISRLGPWLLGLHVLSLCLCSPISFTQSENMHVRPNGNYKLTAGLCARAVKHILNSRRYEGSFMFVWMCAYVVSTTSQCGHLQNASQKWLFVLLCGRAINGLLVTVPLPFDRWDWPQ